MAQEPIVMTDGKGTTLVQITGNMIAIAMVMMTSLGVLAVVFCTAWWIAGPWAFMVTLGLIVFAACGGWAIPVIFYRRRQLRKMREEANPLIREA